MNEKIQNISEKYLDDLKQTMESVYNTHPFPLLADYANAIAEKMIAEAEKDKPSSSKKSSSNEKPLYTGHQIHKPVKTAILKLLESGEMVSEMHGKRTSFYPNGEKYRLHKFSKDFLEKVRVGKNDIHRFTGDTFAIALENASDSKSAIEILTNFFGADHCYHITNIGEKLILVILCGFTALECAERIAQISEIVKTSYDIQHQPIIPEDPFAKARRIKREKNRQAPKALHAAAKQEKQQKEAPKQ